MATQNNPQTVLDITVAMIVRIVFGIFIYVLFNFISGKLTGWLGTVIYIVGILIILKIFKNAVAYVVYNSQTHSRLSKLKKDKRYPSKLNLENKIVLPVSEYIFSRPGRHRVFSSAVNKFVTRANSTYDLSDFYKNHQNSSSLLDLLDEIENVNVPDYMRTIRATDKYPDNVSAILQNAYLYGVVHTCANNIEKAYMRGKNSENNKEYMASRTKDEYIAYMISEHPTTTTIVQNIDSGRWEQIVSIMGYIILISTDNA